MDMLHENGVSISYTEFSRFQQNLVMQQSVNLEKMGWCVLRKGVFATSAKNNIDQYFCFSTSNSGSGR